MKQLSAEIYKFILVGSRLEDEESITICCRNEANLYIFVTPSSDHQNESTYLYLTHVS